MPTQSEIRERLGSKVPPHALASLDRYAEERRPTGGFLRAVLENKLFEAVGRADLANQRALVAICDYVFNCLPDECWGSSEKVDAWLKGRE